MPQGRQIGLNGTFGGGRKEPRWQSRGKKRKGMPLNVYQSNRQPREGIPSCDEEKSPKGGGEKKVSNIKEGAVGDYLWGPGHDKKGAYPTTVSRGEGQSEQSSLRWSRTFGGKKGEKQKMD